MTIDRHRSRGPVTIHAVMVSVFGQGVLISGDSGSGKTRLALALMARGHRLVADDSVHLHRENGRLFGSAPAPTAGLMELKGLGIFDANAAFGDFSVMPISPVNLCLRLDRGCEPGSALDHAFAVNMTLLGSGVKFVNIDISNGWAEAKRVERFVIAG